MATVAGSANINVGRVVQRGFSTIGRNFGGFALLSLLLAGLPNLLIMYVMQGGASAATSVLAWSVSMMVLWLVSLFTAYLLQAALVRASIFDLTGRRVDLGGSLRTALGLILPMLGLAIVSGIGMFIGFLFLIVPGIILYVMWSVALPVLVEERRGVMESLSRSAELTSGSRWRIFGLVLLFAVFYLIVATVVGLIGVGTVEENPLLFALANALTAAIAGLVGAS